MHGKEIVEEPSTIALPCRLRAQETAEGIRTVMIGLKILETQ